MNSSLKKWTGLGLATAFAGTALAACAPGDQGVDEGHSASAAGEMGEGGEGGESGEGGEGGEGGQSIGDLPVPQRAAFMQGHVAVGMALYRAGKLEMAAPHLVHPILETDVDERKGLAELGFDASLYKAAAQALVDGMPAAGIEPQLKAAEANIAMVADKAGGDTASVISYLMDIAVNEYKEGVKDGAVTDVVEYQDAYGFTLVARARADGLEGDGAVKVRAELETLLGLWPEGPVPSARPSPVGQVSAQASKVKLALPKG